MPITTTVQVVNTLASLTFNENGTMDATFSVKLDGERVADKNFHIDATATTAILDAPIPQGFTTMREGVIVGVYQYLISTGKLVGSMS